MSAIQYRLSLPAALSLDEVVHRLRDWHQAASLLPVIKVSPFQILGGNDIKDVSRHAGNELLCALLGLTHIVRVRYDRLGEPSIMTNGQHGRMVEVWPRRAVGFTVQPGFESDRLDLLLVDFPESIQVAGQGEAANRQFDLPTGVTSWVCDSMCSTGGRDSTLIDFLKSHLVVTTLLDYARYLGIDVLVSDEGGYWADRSLEKLMGSFPGNDPPNWSVHAEFLESLSSLCEVTKAVDIHRLGPDSQA